MEKENLNRTLLVELADKVGVTMDDLLSHCRRQELVDDRCMVVALLVNDYHLRQKEVAMLLQISQPAVSNLLARHENLMKFDASYRNHFKSIINQ
jgi:predicted XRE-type DNA-binding protein